jgi:hypothetical protein
MVFFGGGVVLKKEISGENEREKKEIKNRSKIPSL